MLPRFTIRVLSVARRLTSLYIVIIALVGVALFLKAVPNIQAGLDETHYDLSVDRLTALAFLDHYNPYTPEGAKRSGLAAFGPTGHGHPPTTSFWFLPVARLDDRTAGNALGWLSVLLLSFQLIATMTGLRYPAPFSCAWLLLTYVLSCTFMRYHFAVGQISTLIGFLFFVAWWAGRRKEDWLAGAALGVACTLKLFPGVIVVLFLVIGRWRVVLAAVGLYLFVAIYMTAGFGLGSWRLFLAQQKPIADLWMGSIQNQSIHGIVLRLFHPVCGPHVPVLLKATVISTIVSLLLLSAAMWLVRKARRHDAFDISYALFVVVSVVTSQWTWEHYTVIYALPALILAANLPLWWRLKRRVSAALIGTVLALIVVSWQIDVDLKNRLQYAVRVGAKDQHLRLHVYDLLNWTPGIVLLLLLFYACFRSPRLPAEFGGASSQLPPYGTGGDHLPSREAVADPA